MNSQMRWIGLLLVGLIGIVGCYDPTSNSVDAGGAAAKSETEVEIGSGDLVFKLDGNNCDLKWTGSNSAGMTPYGYFYELEGQVVLDGKSRKVKQFEVTIDMPSVKAMNESLTEKLKNQGFFEVEKYPTARFVSTSISEGPREGDPEGTTDVIEGNFQLRDVTKSISFPVVVSLNGDSLTVSSEFKLNRKDFGVVYSNSVEDALIRDDVLINLDIEAEK